MAKRSPPDYVILQDDVDMLALESLFNETPERLFSFRAYLDRMLTEIVNDCHVLANAEMQIQMSLNWYANGCLDDVEKYPYAFICDQKGNVDASNPRADKRTKHRIVLDLANNIRRQLEIQQLYDDQGILQYELASVLRTGNSSLEIRLQRV